MGYSFAPAPAMTNTSLLPCTELQSYIKGASRDLRNEMTSWAGSALTSFNQALQKRTGKTLQDYGVNPDAIGALAYA